MMVTPDSRRRRTNCHMSRRNSPSTPAVGSSRNKRAGAGSQACLAGAVGAQEPQDLAPPDLEVDALERFKAGRIGLEEIFDLDDRLHGTLPRCPLRSLAGRWRHLRLQVHYMLVRRR